MKLTKLHQNKTQSLLHPITGRTYYWKNFNKIEHQPPPPEKSGTPSGGHYDALLKGDLRKEKYFGGPSLGPM